MPTYGTPQDYEGESDAKDLSRAHEIRRDKKRHSKAMKHLKKLSKSNSHHTDTHAFEAKNSQGALTNGDGSDANGQNEGAK